MSNVVTKVIDFRHKAPDQAIHELMQAAKDGFAVTKIATRFNHTHVYLETSYKQVSTKQVGEANSKQEYSGKVESTQEVAEEPVVKVETTPTKTATKKTTAKSVASTKATATTKKVEQGDKDSE